MTVTLTEQDVLALRLACDRFVKQGVDDQPDSSLRAAQIVGPLLAAVRTAELAESAGIPDREPEWMKDPMRFTGHE
jgi:hypothetical protein